MRTLQIKEYEIMLDDEDYEMMKDLKFWPSKQKGGRVYFQLADMKNRQYLHRMIAKADKGDIVDHINRNTLDNRKDNLSCVNKSLNAHNTGLRPDNTSGYRGVTQDKTRKKCWRAHTHLNSVYHYLGSFYSREEAIEAVKHFRKTHQLPMI